jgi:hypothetical protein
MTQKIVRYRLWMDISSDIFEASDCANIDEDGSFSSLSKVNSFEGLIPAGTSDLSLFGSLSAIDFLYLSSDADLTVKIGGVGSTPISVKIPDVGQKAVVFMMLGGAASVLVSAVGDANIKAVGGKR